ncbi:unnamed protein product, partial [Dovyalis caffra]
ATAVARKLEASVVRSGVDNDKQSSNFYEKPFDTSWNFIPYLLKNLGSCCPPATPQKSRFNYNT